MSELLNLEIYQFIFIFLRIGSAIMLMPGFMSSYVNARQRLSIALAITLVLVPFLSSSLPAAPTDFLEMSRMCLFEITYGVFLGFSMQVIYSALTLVGNLIGQAIGFSNAQIFDPAFQTQTIVIETFLSITALTVIFVTDLHHLMLSAVIDSYSIFPVGAPLPVADFSNFLSETLNKSFIMGFKIGSPFIAFTVVFYVGMGLVSRLMPQLNIFFLSLPLQIYLGLSLLFITAPMMILWFMKYFEESIEQFAKGG